MLSLMFPKTISRPESFIAEVAGDDDSFKMVCFNVIFYVWGLAFLSTNFAPMSKPLSTTNGNYVFTLLHH